MAEEAHVRKSNTLFVRNLPLSTTNEKLENVFSDIGPIKQCFVVTDKGSKACKGYGFVKFSLIDDAESAKEKIKSLDGRKLFINYADRKKENARKKKKEKGKSEPKNQQPRANDRELDRKGIKEKGQQIEESKRMEKSDDSSDDDEDEEVEKEDEDANFNSSSKSLKFVDKDKISKENQERKYLNSKTILVTGWTKDMTQQKVQEILNNLVVRNVAKLEYPMKSREEYTALIRFKCIRDMKRGLNKIQGKEIKGCSLLAVQMKRDTQTVLDQIPQNQLKKCRLIVRNLSFKSTEKDLLNAFEKFGFVTETKIPMKPGGKSSGFGFVQFTNTKDASRAIAEMNRKPILGRPVAVDWAIAKDKFTSISVGNPNQDAQTSKKTDLKSKDEDDDGSSSNEDSSEDESSDDEESSEDTSGSEDHGRLSPPKLQKKNIVEDRNKARADNSDSDEDDKTSDSDDSSDKEDSSEDNLSDEGFEDEEEGSVKDSPKKKKKNKRKQSSRKSDVDEGKTVFIRNLSYHSTEESLEDKFSQFGQMEYCKVVRDPMTDHSRGTAFVRFQSSEAAEKCVEKSNDESKNGGIVLDHRKLNVTIAVSRDKAKELKNKEKKVKVDKRNLHLVREGMIRPGTQDAQGLTKDDLLRRGKLEKVKRQKLKNPNIFVSTTRLSVHNLPVSVDEKQLRKVFLKAAEDKKAVINECRIMRDIERVNAEGVGKSRGFGFVNFTDHQHALQALKGANNNPDLFTEKRRLIVEFSLENKAALEAKEKRLERQQARREALQKAKDGQAGGNAANSPKKKRPHKAKSAKLTDKYIGKTSLPEGVDAKKIPKGLPSHWGPKVRHKPRPQPGGAKKKGGKNRNQGKDFNAHGENRKRKNPANSSQVTEPEKKKMKKGKKQSDDFDRLVSKYKQTFLSSSAKSKWFDS
ncbi:hypothetical protein FSP39_006867 [Pinctada imbricata]|uniref:RRM domain-containing protein n=1 Tax=Pinctada imbricata TaxID=66713 RepID=A0AA89C043_PINIB|nr:hypothetical protein FSP39_006867 [Pinctada imbricata]